MVPVQPGNLTAKEGIDSARRAYGGAPVATTIRCASRRRYRASTAAGLARVGRG